MRALQDTAAPVAIPRQGIDWSPYLLGVAIGALSWVAFAVANEPLGITTALSRVGAPLAAAVVGPEAVAHNSYWSKIPFSFDYGVLFLIGIVAGGFVSSLVSGSFRIEVVPHLWEQRFGGSPLKRMVVAFFGGALMMYGARLAGGCTSGHGISGSLQLALSSWVFLIVMFVTGLVASAVLFGRRAKGA